METLLTKEWRVWEHIRNTIRPGNKLYKPLKLKTKEYKTAIKKNKNYVHTEIQWSRHAACVAEFIHNFKVFVIINQFHLNKH